MSFDVSTYICGDANGSGDIDIDDAVDAECSGEIDIDDVVYLISYIFSGGPAPCAACE